MGSEMCIRDRPPRNGAEVAVIKPNCRIMQLAGNFGNFPKVNIRQNSALLNPSRLDYAPSAGFEQRCNSDYTRPNALASPRGRKLRPSTKLMGGPDTQDATRSLAGPHNAGICPNLLMSSTGAAAGQLPPVHPATVQRVASVHLLSLRGRHSFMWFIPEWEPTSYNAMQTAAIGTVSYTHLTLPTKA